MMEAIPPAFMSFISSLDVSGRSHKLHPGHGDTELREVELIFLTCVRLESYTHYSAQNDIGRQYLSTFWASGGTLCLA